MIAEAGINIGMMTGAIAAGIAAGKVIELAIPKFRNGHGKYLSPGPELCRQHAERLTRLETEFAGMKKDIKHGFARIEEQLRDLKGSKK